jgi:single-stranded DNA-binding protein
LDKNHNGRRQQVTSKTLITLYGNVGGDPETRTLPAKEVAKSYYDPIVDEVVERQYTTSDREVRTFSIAVSKRDPDGKDVTRWIRCDDWNQHSRLVAKGDRVKVKGYFRERSYEKDGETKTVRDFVVKDLKIERRKIREEVP